ncbi:MAG: asparaginase [Rhodospirillales bacterium]|nr:asparaginase [Rhodospirillales bacterium]
MNPVLVEVSRGGRVESAHRGAFVVADAAGGVVLQAGDIDAAVFPRSAVKALQALPLVESGAADRLGLSDAEIALACASHGGEPAHVATARSMLAKAGRDAACLECGAHWPSDARAARALAAAGEAPTALHNNCSGKHAGFICLACACGDDPAGYVGPDHPTMRRVTAALAEATGTRLDADNRGTDGCSIPTYAIPLRALAGAFARFGTAGGAAARLRAAVAANPFMVGGSDRFDTVLMTALGARAFSKGGAEGVHCAALPELGLGIAVKCDDGAGRAADLVCAALIARSLGDGVPESLLRPELRNWNGIAVGALRAAGPLAA